MTHSYLISCWYKTLMTAARIYGSEHVFIQAVHRQEIASCSRDYAKLIYLHRCEAALYSGVCYPLWPCESCVSNADKSPKLSEGEVCKSSTVHRATSLNASRSSIITRGWISCLSRQKIIAFKVLRSSMKNVKKKSCVKMCWLWGKRALYLPQGRGDPLICVPRFSDHVS